MVSATGSVFENSRDVVFDENVRDTSCQQPADNGHRVLNMPAVPDFLRTDDLEAIVRNGVVVGVVGLDVVTHWSSGNALHVDLAYFHDEPECEEAALANLEAVSQHIMTTAISHNCPNHIIVFDRTGQEDRLIHLGLKKSTYNEDDTYRCWGDMYAWEMYGDGEGAPTNEECLTLSDQYFETSSCKFMHSPVAVKYVSPKK